MKRASSFIDKLPISRKFAKDTAWNITSFGFMGITGILLNILIAKYYTVATLGVFNQVYAIYILFSQLAVCGIHFSVLKHVSQFKDDASLIQNILISALFVVIIHSALITTTCYLLKNVFGIILGSVDVSRSIQYALPGLFMFSINKVLLAFHNALRHMAAYAIFRSLRYLLLLLALTGLIILDVNSKYISIIFSVSETFLSIVLLLFSLKWLKFKFSKEILLWLKEHLFFGYKAVVGNLLMDVNTRVDVLMLGIFASDKIVGIYSFAAMLAEGFNQLPASLLINVNPIITDKKFKSKPHELEKKLRKGKNLSYVFLVPMGILAIICFPLIIKSFGFETELLNGWVIFTILICGTLVAAGYIPFKMIFNQLGFPNIQTLFFFLVFITNVILNLILIPLWGMYGAAIATASAVVMQIAYLKYLLYSRSRITF